MNKKGFTLIEIIVVIALLAVVGTSTSVAVIKVNDKKEKNILIENEDKFKNAIDVYLSNHSEVVKNINNNAEGAVISLELLKNEGLISDNLKINYKDNYYVVSNALLSNIKPSDLDGECKDSVSLEIIANWQKKNNSSEVLYFCPKESVKETVYMPIPNQTPIEEEPEEEEKAGESSYIVVDPKKACEESILYKDSLVCKIISNAENAPSDYADSITELVEKDDEDIGTKITHIGQTAFLRENPIKYDIKKFDFTSYDTINDYFLNYKKTCIFKEKDLEFDSTTGNFNLKTSASYEYIDNNDFSNYEIGRLNYLMEKTQEGYVFSIVNTSYGDDCTKYKFNEIITNITCNDAESIKCNSDGTFKTGDNKYKYTSKISEIYTEKTLRTAKDDYGKSYYFRGGIKDNYVTFNDMCWRVVRIQGDGSVKLLLASKNGPCSETNLTENSALIGTGENYSSKGTWGRTYMEAFCTSSGTHCYNPDYKHGEMHETFIEWANEKIINKNLLKKENFCLGQAENEKDINYNRIRNGEYSLICDSESNIGDRLTLKERIGTITVDELIYSGADYSGGNGYLNTTYIKENAENAWYTLSPGFSYYVYTITPPTYHSTYLILNEQYYFGTYMSSGYNYNLTHAYYRPLIVLKPNVIIDTTKESNGAINNPYVIKEN